MNRLALLLAVCAAPALGCVGTETYSRDLPPRESAPPPRRRPPPRQEEAPPPPPDREPPQASLPPATGSFHVPPDRVPARGLCRIWYDELPPDRQPESMDCGRAHRIARRRGGRVIWDASGHASQDGAVATTEYGQVDLRGVPPDRMPPPGYCRVWLDGVPPERQPEPAPCPQAEREAQRTGGRLLYLPSARGQ